MDSFWQVTYKTAVDLTLMILVVEFGKLIDTEIIHKYATFIIFAMVSKGIHVLFNIFKMCVMLWEDKPVRSYDG